MTFHPLENLTLKKLTSIMAKAKGEDMKRINLFFVIVLTVSVLAWPAQARATKFPSNTNFSDFCASYPAAS